MIINVQDKRKMINSISKLFWDRNNKKVDWIQIKSGKQIRISTATDEEIELLFEEIKISFRKRVAR